MGATLSMLGRGLGVVAGGALAVLWVYAIWFPGGGLTITGLSVLVAGLMALFALVAAIAATKGHAVVIFVVFVASFLPVGAMLLGVAHWLRFVGILDCLLLVAGGMIWTGARLERGHG